VVLNHSGIVLVLLAYTTPITHRRTVRVAENGFIYDVAVPVGRTKTKDPLRYVYGGPGFFLPKAYDLMN